MLSSRLVDCFSATLNFDIAHLNFSASIEQLHKLKVLDVSSNQLTEFKFDFTKMDQLLSVNLCNNLLTTFSLKAPMLHVLNLAQNSISQFPEVIPPSVTDLNISKNKMSELPHDLQLPNLKNLDLSENLLSAVPKNLGRLKLKSKFSNVIGNFTILLNLFFV